MLGHGEIEQNFNSLAEPGVTLSNSTIRDQEVDALVEEGLLPREDQWNVELRNGFQFPYPEAVVTVKTGHPYPAGPVAYEIKNLTMPRTIVDQLRINLRQLI